TEGPLSDRLGGGGHVRDRLSPADFRAVRDPAGERLRAARLPRALRTRRRRRPRVLRPALGRVGEEVARGGDLAAPPSPPILLASPPPRRRQALESLRGPVGGSAP